MTVPVSVRLIDWVRDRIREPVTELDAAGLAEARGPYVGGPAVVQRLNQAVTGRPDPDVAITTVEVPGAVGPLPACRHEPPDLAPGRPLVLHLHGGGWVVGGPVQYDWICGELAVGLGAVVVSVDYRKAPEHPAPAAPDDAIAVARWLLAEGGGERLGAAGPVVVAGDSAGGNLAALVALAARDEGLSGLAAQLLVYPATDLTMTSRSATTLTDEPILTRAQMDDFVAMYLAGGIDPADPRVSPLHAPDVAGVAPACVQTAERDPLRDEGNAYAARLEDAGVTVRLSEYVDMPHGFVSMPGLLREARQAVSELVHFARPLIGN